MFARLIVVGSVAAGLGTLYLISRLRTYQGRPGAWLLVATLIGQTVFCLGYGGALLVFDPFWRRLLETVVILMIPWLGVLFLGFTFGYTGRGHLLRSWWYRVPVVTAVVLSGLTVTNSLHGLVWQGFAVTGVGAVAGGSYTHEPVLFVMVGLSTLWVAIGTMLLFDTVVSYGPLFRGEAVAVGLSPLAPGLALLVWVFEIGPEPAINFTAAAFLPHVALDGYAFLKRDMFEFLPGTRRAGEQAAIQDLGSPVVIVDTDGRIVTLNAAAEGLVGHREEKALTRSLSDLLGAEIDLAGEDQRRSIRSGGQKREFVVTPAELTDTAGTRVGYTVVFQDVTDAIQREQRLMVLNRILRHNLRNDLNVVHGTLEAGRDHVEDDDLSEMLDRAASKAWGLVETGEKIREIEGLIEESDERETVRLHALLADVVEEFEGSHISLHVPETLTVRTNPALLEVIVRNLLENALDHGTPPVELTGSDETEQVRITITDEGPGIPENELETFEQGTETDLVHSSGVGLWLVNWGTGQLGGDVTFETDEKGTTVALTLPQVE